jgi:glycosyltransferase involved in cell wall biosynthesis
LESVASADQRLTVSVIVPVHNGADVLGDCLDALAAQTYDGRWEVIVVDNASDDATARLASSHRVQPRVVSEPQRGSYAARNAGVRASTSDVFAFTDADCRPEPDWIARGVRPLQDGRAALSAGRVHAIPSEQASIWERYDRAAYLDQKMFVEQLGRAATANLFVKRNVFDAVGMFEAGFISGGDFDFCQRATKAGFVITYVDDAVVHHLPRTTMGEFWRLHRRLAVGWRMMARKGNWPRALKDPAMRPRLAAAAEQVAQDGVRIRRRRLLLVHSVVIAARWTGRVTGR